MPYLVAKMLKTELRFSIDILINKCEPNCNENGNANANYSRPPFNSIDFTCNSLKLTKNGIDVMGEDVHFLSFYDKCQKIETITQDIINKVARIVNFKKHRVKKMMFKGWTILSNSMIVNFPQSVSACISGSVSACVNANGSAGAGSENVTVTENSVCDTCVICMEPTNLKITLQIGCCSAKYHFHCFKKLYEYPNPNVSVKQTKKCPHCRQGVFFNKVDESLLTIT